jgi:hypothetical protein
LGARDPARLLLAAPVAARARANTHGSWAPAAAAAAAAAPGAASATAEVAGGHSSAEPWVPATLLLTHTSLHLHASGRGSALWLSLPLHQVPTDALRRHPDGPRAAPFLLLTGPATTHREAPGAAERWGGSPPSDHVVVVGLSSRQRATLVEAVEDAQRRHEMGDAEQSAALTSKRNAYSV